jgi:hypothetical protein
MGNLYRIRPLRSRGTGHGSPISSAISTSPCPLLSAGSADRCRTDCSTSARSFVERRIPSLLRSQIFLLSGCPSGGGIKQGCGAPFTEESPRNRSTRFKSLSRRPTSRPCPSAPQTDRIRGSPRTDRCHPFLFDPLSPNRQTNPAAGSASPPASAARARIDRIARRS